MVNFRLKEEDVDRVDGAAERLSMSRSDFIRKSSFGCGYPLFGWR